jgi:hypothetical protein
MWTDLAALRYNLGFCEDNYDFSAISWPVVGRFKAHTGQLRCYMVPIAGTTNSGITFVKWTQRFVGRLAMDGYCQGWAFKNKDETRAKSSQFMEDIYQRLETIQSETSLIDPDCDIRVEYGTQRSGRRFLTTEATTVQGIKLHILEYHCRSERSVNRSIILLYSEMRNMKTLLIQPSQVC